MDNVALYRNIMLKLDGVVKKSINEMNYNIGNHSFTNNDFSMFISDDESYEKYNMSVGELEKLLNDQVDFDDLWISGVDDGIQIWTADKSLYDTLCAYLKELERTYGNPRIGALHEDLNLNRGDVYQFGNICLRPLVKETIKNNKPKWEPIQSKDDKTISVIYKVGNKKLYISLLNNFGTKPFIRFSMFNFTSKVINAFGFIDNDKVYIIEKDKVLAVWNNPKICTVETKMYRDANGSNSMFTQVKKQWLIDNADYVMNVDTTSKDYIRYISNYKNFALSESRHTKYQLLVKDFENELDLNGIDHPATELIPRNFIYYKDTDDTIENEAFFDLIHSTPGKCLYNTSVEHRKQIDTFTKHYIDMDKVNAFMDDPNTKDGDILYDASETVETPINEVKYEGEYLEQIDLGKYGTIMLYWNYAKCPGAYWFCDEIAYKNLTGKRKNFKLTEDMDMYNSTLPEKTYTVFSITPVSYKAASDTPFVGFTIDQVEEFLRKITTNDDCPEYNFKNLMRDIINLKHGKYLLTPRYRYGQCLIYAQ